ncbi:MAG: PEP/pyruvate-binding domain-containing protein, partial [Candidatus Nanopelagicus sp.]
MAKQLIYPFTFGDKSKSDLLGGKGANLAEMVQMGLPVPPGFTITTDACREYLTTGDVPAQLDAQIKTALSNLEKVVEKKFGDPKNPLLVSVRSGAKHSMPGMMETVLNVGITPEVADAMAKASGNERFAWDSYRRFIDMFGRIVCDLPDETVHKIESTYLQKMNVKVVADLPAQSLKELAQDLIKAIESHSKQPFPTDPIDHLTQSIEAVFKSWNSERAQLYRRRERIPSDLGTAVNIQSMVFG